MLCPSCGADVSGVNAAGGAGVCPTCGRRLPTAMGAPPSPAAGSVAPGTWPPAPPAYGAFPTPPPGYPPYGRAAPPSAPYGYPPYGASPYGQVAPTGGQMPPWPGYVPLPPAPRRPDRTPLLVGILVAILVLAVGTAALYLVHLNGANANSLSPTTTAATPSPIPSPTPSPTPGAVVIYQDSLKTGAADWAEVPNHCFDRSDGYHIKNGYICYVPVGNQQDFTVTVTMRQISGPTTYPYGIDFRLNGTAYYEFDVYAKAEWALFKCVSSTAGCTKLVDFTPNSAIKGGLNVANTLEVRAVGARFTLFANGRQVGSAKDSAYSAGRIGVSTDQNMEVVATNMTVWQLP